MALRSKTMTKGPDPEEPAQEMFSQRRRPETGQFLLQVDRQTKASFTTFEAAEAAGRVIKKNFPVVRVAIYDSVTCVNKIIELEKALPQARIERRRRGDSPAERPISRRTGGCS
jgi:hypothetical protein